MKYFAYSRFAILVNFALGWVQDLSIRYRRDSSLFQNKFSIQSLDYTSLYLCTKELHSQLVPGRVENVIQYSTNNIALHVRVSNNNLLWV